MLQHNSAKKILMCVLPVILLVFNKQFISCHSHTENLIHQQFPQAHNTEFWQR